MKKVMKLSVLFLMAVAFAACGGSEKEEKPQVKLGDYSKKETKEVKKDDGPIIDLSNKGIGPIKSLVLPDGIDTALAAKGEDVFGKMCTACHKIDRKFIGPKIEGVSEKRSPEWIMNMILNPEEMIQKDPIAQQLLIESNMAVMANQNLTEDEARSILEYFRQIDQ